MGDVIFLFEKLVRKTILKKISKIWFTKHCSVDIITVVSKKFRRRSSKMIEVNTAWKTLYVTITHSTRLEWMAN
jgi:hypothetical protein